MRIRVEPAFTPVTRPAASTAAMEASSDSNRRLPAEPAGNRAESCPVSPTPRVMLAGRGETDLGALRTVTLMEAVRPF